MTSPGKANLIFSALDLDKCRLKKTDLRASGGNFMPVSIFRASEKSIEAFTKRFF